MVNKEAMNGKIKIKTAPRAFAPADLYWGLRWMAGKLIFATVPVRVVIGYWRLAGLYNYFFSPYRERIEKTLADFYGETKTKKEIKRMVRRHFGYLKEHELIRYLPKVRGFYKPEKWPLEGLENLTAAIARGKGTILLSAHFGYTALLKYILEMNGYKIRLVRAQNSERMKRYKKAKKRFKKYSRFKQYLHRRFRVEADVHYKDDLSAEFNIRPIVNALKNNEIVLILGDALHAVNFINFNFLNNPCPFPTGFMSIAMATDAAVLPTFVIEHHEGYGIKTVIGAPLPIQKGKGPGPEILAENIRHYVEILEAYVKEYPHLFRMWHKEEWYESRHRHTQKELSRRY